MAPRLALVCLALFAALAFSFAPAAARGLSAATDTPTPADTSTPTPTDTPTPTSTPSPAIEATYTLTSGNQFVITRSFTYGELAIFLAIVAQCALYGLRWIDELTRGRGGR